MIGDSYKPKALLIDLDGTLADSHPVLLSAYSIFLKRFGHVARQEEFQELMGPSLPEIVALLKTRYQIPGETSTLLSLYQEGIEHAYRTEVRLFPGAKKTLSYAKSHGIKLVLVSSAEKHLVYAFLEGASFLSHFYKIVSKESALKTKPHPDLYLKALDLLKIKGCDALAIEDAPSGVQSATSAKIPTLWITHNQPQVDKFPEGLLQIVADWTAIEVYLRGLESE